MRVKVNFALFLVVAALVAAMAVLRRHEPQTAGVESSKPETVSSSSPARSPTSPLMARPSEPRQSTLPHQNDHALVSAAADKPAESTNKLDRLAQIREAFRALAGGDRTNAMHAAKQIKDDTERETALLTLVTEWTQGNLRSPVERAQAIADHGLEAGLGMELAKNPELAMLWANEMTDASGRAAILQQVARVMVGSDPATAFALSGQVPEGDRRNFVSSIFAGWAGDDTDAAIQYANQLPDPSDRDAAMQAIRTTAPVGIGTALRIENGYPVVDQVLPGAAADLNGQLHAGDRIVAWAGADGLFVNAQNLPLQQVVQAIRGAPNTALQLQIIPAGAPPDSAPQTISIMRDQIKFKH
jgi:PDZ domain